MGEEGSTQEEEEPQIKPFCSIRQACGAAVCDGLVRGDCLVLKKYDRMVSRPTSSMGQQLLKLKNKADPLKMHMSVTIYKVGYKNCEKCYIGETTRPLYVRQKEHQAEAEMAHLAAEETDSNTTKYKSALVEHTATTNHVIVWEAGSTLQRVLDRHMHGIKKAIHIKNNPTI